MRIVLGRTQVSLELDSPHPPDVCALRLEAALAREAGRQAHGLSRQVAGVMRGHGFSIGFLSQGASDAELAVDSEIPTRWVRGEIEGWGDAPGSRIRLESDRKPVWDRLEQFLFYLAWTVGFLLLFWALAYLRSGEIARAGGMLIAMAVPLLLAALYYRPSLIGRVAIEDRRLVSFVRAACDAELVEVRDVPAEPRVRRRGTWAGAAESREAAPTEGSRRQAAPPAVDARRIEAVLPAPVEVDHEADPARGAGAQAPPANWSRSVEGPYGRSGSREGSTPSDAEDRPRPQRPPHAPRARGEPDRDAERRGPPGP